VRLEVADNGMGMDPQTRERIFEPFFTTKDVGKGTGLGLATVYGILQRHQGWIECQSQPGQGTTFSLYLPVAAESRPPHQAPDEAEMPRGAETLLVIDDEELVRHSTVRVFARLGYQVLEAPDGPGGLELFAQHGDRIDLVLLDLSMPGLSGREVLAQMRAQRPGLKMMLFTGYAPAPGEFSGVASVVEKPFSVHHLSRVVRQVLDA
jgi:CheY-like chemotaxis protein